MFFSLSSTTRTCSPPIAASFLVWQREDEAAAVSGLAFDPDLAAVQLDEALLECEPQARALALLDSDVGLLELFEDAWLVLGCDPRPSGCHRHLHLAVDPACRDDQLPSLGRA